jgi:sulfhydrogenase subunit beta (sulfur reductase)
MESFVLQKDEFKEILDAVMDDYEVIGPMEEDGRIYFRPLDRMDEVMWEFDNPVNNIKDFFFPPRQKLYELKEGTVVTFEKAYEKKRIILLARPCDARALRILDTLFLEDYEDQQYKAARDNTIVMGLSCLVPDQRCFCLSLGGSPFGTEGMDVLITAFQRDRLIISPITGKGKDIFKGKGRKAKEEELQSFEKVKKKAEESVKREMRVPDNLPAQFNSEYWGDISRACISCGVCTYLCPTCHCFDIVDEESLRIRCWDTCSFDNFTRMASGENPRKNKFERYRQRIYHKFSYYKINFGDFACVGCGRCSRYCPVKMDIVEIVNNAGSSH